MKNLPALRAMDALEEADIDWMLESGEESTCIASSILIREGEDPGAVYLILDGLFEVHLKAVQSTRIGLLGPGEIVGEIAFVEGGIASATVTAVETSRVLRLPYQLLRNRLAEEKEFGTRFHRALALIACHRLRTTNAALGNLSRRDTTQRENSAEVATELSEIINDFRQMASRAEAEMLKEGELSDGLRETFAAQFIRMYENMDRLIGDGSPLHSAARQELGARAQIEILPYVLLTETAERFYSKPRGYAGDFFTIEMIYRNIPGGAGRLGPALDAAFLHSPAANAVKNRRGLLKSKIVETVKSVGRPARILSLACGPARELFDAFEDVGTREAIDATVVDIDLQALAFVSDRRDKLRLQNRIEPIHGNLIYLALGRQKLDIPPQDLVYSIGLIDYFNDKFVLKLLNWAWERLAPGGRVILGNFHPANKCKAFMDHILDWRLIHRTEEDMHRLFLESNFGQPCTAVQFEAEGVNLFAECVKA